MIIFLYGPDTYRSGQKLKEIIDYYQKIHKSGLNLKYFNGENLTFDNFLDEIQQSSMFDEKKLIVLENVIADENFKESFLKNPGRFVNLPNIILFYERREILKTDPLFKFLKKNGKSQEFKLIVGQQLRNWIKKEFARYQVKIEIDALEKFIDFVGNNLWQIINEIKKLVSYKKKNKIEVADIELLIRPKIETEIFKTVDAIALKNKKQAFQLIHQHLEKGDSPLYLLSMINFQFRNLLAVKSCESKDGLYSNYAGILSDYLKLHPYVIKKSYSQAQKFTIEELKKIYQKIFQLDLAIKTGKIEPETALNIFIAEI